MFRSLFINFTCSRRGWTWLCLVSWVLEW